MPNVTEEQVKVMSSPSSGLLLFAVNVGVVGLSEEYEYIVFQDDILYVMYLIQVT